MERYEYKDEFDYKNIERIERIEEFTLIFFKDNFVEISFYYTKANKILSYRMCYNREKKVTETLITGIKMNMEDIDMLKTCKKLMLEVYNKEQD